MTKHKMHVGKGKIVYQKSYGKSYEWAWLILLVLSLVGSGIISCLFLAIVAGG